MFTLNIISLVISIIILILCLGTILYANDNVRVIYSELFNINPIKIK